ncbi:MAG: type II secretion system protein [Phormidium sp. GEM2.Bin31]|nr:MAG: type II secretion system protein [Phormidium sp. GEM2.Bin31]
MIPRLIRERLIRERSLARRRSPTQVSTPQGFTTIEVLVVIVMLGILAAIAAPGWLSFVNNQRVKNTADAALQTMRRAQSRASTENRTWEASFRLVEGEGVQGSAHPRGGNPSWTTLSPDAGNLVTLDLSRTTMPQTCDHGDYCIRFEDRGVVSSESYDNPNAAGDDSGTIARIAFADVDGGDNPNRRCVIVSTILGSIRGDRCED